MTCIRKLFAVMCQRPVLRVIGGDAVVMLGPVVEQCWLSRSGWKPT